ncbi:hypothetical protein L1987_00034 [Smallanthus sonchifolius]|uniref:Uncharacterized protein n=1 Tax=Smallanthus sonchifolius TaxID=185202 RepID=A0ACB9K1B7_9ASTR|nr:hypothetical protein L1987_00034 [Smallanthus sonchifolius]
MLEPATHQIWHHIGVNHQIWYTRRSQLQLEEKTTTFRSGTSIRLDSAVRTEGSAKIKEVVDFGDGQQSISLEYRKYIPSGLNLEHGKRGYVPLNLVDNYVQCPSQSKPYFHRPPRNLVVKCLRRLSSSAAILRRHQILSRLRFRISFSCSCWISLFFSYQMEAQFFRFLKIVGVGFKARAESEGRLLFLKLGYSHEVELTVPPAVRVFCFKPNIVCCTGIDKQRVHQFAAAVRSCKPPEVYKGKGIMYVDEVIKKKQGKKSK